VSVYEGSSFMGESDQTLTSAVAIRKALRMFAHLAMAKFRAIAAKSEI
jgi:hypothetical protein